MIIHISFDRANYEINKRKGKASKYVNDTKSLDKFLDRLSHKLKRFPKYGDQISTLPYIISMIRDFTTGKYHEVPIKSILSIIGALIYFISPLDIIPDFLPIVGISDDLSIFKVAFDYIKNDLDNYLLWKETHA